MLICFCENNFSDRKTFNQNLKLSLSFYWQLWLILPFQLKENQLKELEAQAESFLQQLHSMPPIPLQEPTVTFSAAIMPIKGATSLSGLKALLF